MVVSVVSIIAFNLINCISMLNVAILTLNLQIYFPLFDKFLFEGSFKTYVWLGVYVD